MLHAWKVPRCLFRRTQVKGRFSIFVSTRRGWVQIAVMSRWCCATVQDPRPLQRALRSLSSLKCTCADAVPLSFQLQAVEGSKLLFALYNQYCLKVSLIFDPFGSLELQQMHFFLQIFKAMGDMRCRSMHDHIAFVNLQLLARGHVFATGRIWTR